MKVEVIYSLPAKSELVKLDVADGTTVLQAVEASGLLEKYPEIDVKKNKFGVYAKLAKADAVLRERDRVEIYRPLLADPKAGARPNAILVPRGLSSLERCEKGWCKVEAGGASGWAPQSALWGTAAPAQCR